MTMGSRPIWDQIPCKKCGQFKHYEQFAVTVTGRRAKVCWDCDTNRNPVARSEHHRRYRVENIEAKRERDRRYYHNNSEDQRKRSRRYRGGSPTGRERGWKKAAILSADGIGYLTIVEFEARLVAQGNACAICKVDYPGQRNWNADHDHKTGLFRGVLCQRCNHAIGLLRENPTIVRAAADYLEL